MLYEYAVEPKALSSWPAYQHLVGQFGVDKGRLISRFPKRWKAMVYDSLEGCSPMERKKIEESLSHMSEQLKPRICEWSNSLEWRENAMEEHSQRPFQAILAGENPTDEDFIIATTEIDPVSPPPLWSIETSLVVERSADTLKKALMPLLEISKEVVLIDPYFKPGNRRHRIVLESLIQGLREYLCIQAWPRIEIITAENRPRVPDTFMNDCELHIGNSLPAGATISLRRVSSRLLHNRYLLTDCGGIQFGDGIEDPGPDGRINDCLNLMGKRAVKQVRSAHDSFASIDSIVLPPSQ